MQSQLSKYPGGLPSGLARGAGVVPVLAVVAIMYVAIGSVLGFVQGGIGPILRARGTGLAAMHWVFALYLPFGVAFLWAPWIDARQLPWLGYRTGWIVTAQLLAVAATVCIALLPGGSVPVLFVLGLLATASVATMDLALDALTVEHTTQQNRALAAAAKMSGLSIGLLLGGGVLVGLFPSMGWRLTFLALAAILGMSVLSVLMLVGPDRTAHRQPGRSLPSLRGALQAPRVRQRLLCVVLLTVMLMALFNLNRLLLVDMGVPLQRIGAVFGTSAPLANLAASVVAGWAGRRWSSDAVCRVAGALCLASVGFVIVGIGRGDAALAMAGSTLVGAASAGMFIGIGSAILTWAGGTQPATAYALYYSSGRLVGTIALLVMPGVIASIGWLAFYTGAALAFVGAAGGFLVVLRPPRQAAAA